MLGSKGAAWIGVGGIPTTMGGFVIVIAASADKATGGFVSVAILSATQTPIACFSSSAVAFVVVGSAPGLQRGPRRTP